MRLALESAPDLIKPNAEECEALIGFIPKTSEEFVRATALLREKSAHAIISDGGAGAWFDGEFTAAPEVKVLDTLLVDFCRREGAKVVIRGVRVYSDFEYEFQMALTNRRLAPEIETLFMMPSENLAYVTASTVREIARYGGDTSPFVTPAVQRRLKPEG